MMRIRSAAYAALEAGFWKPASVRLMVATRPWRRRSSEHVSAATRLVAAAGWLCRAQDATGDGGVSWGYRLRSGWGASYPETTGYIIPTFLALAEATGDGGYRTRAGRCVEFLAGVQLSNGAFPAGTVAAVPRTPSVFNTGQVIGGLAAWYRASSDERVLRIAHNAADWLVGVQDDDGAWRRFGYLDYPVTYMAHAACSIGDLGVLTGDARYVDSASRHLDWVLAQQDPTSGWFERSGFTNADHRARRALTHTFAYTLSGVLRAGILLHRSDAVAAVWRPARSLADLMLSTGWLPGVIDARWQGLASSACLTGDAQMALVWMSLAELEPDALLNEAAERAVTLVGAAQSLKERHPGIHGGIPGSDPVWGRYVRFAFPNWAAKFYIDALLAQRIRAMGPRAAGTPPGGPGWPTRR